MTCTPKGEIRHNADVCGMPDPLHCSKPSKNATWRRIIGVNSMENTIHAVSSSRGPRGILVACSINLSALETPLDFPIGAARSQCLAAMHSTPPTLSVKVRLPKNHVWCTARAATLTSVGNA